MRVIKAWNTLAGRYCLYLADSNGIQFQLPYNGCDEL
jgi:hypothetical protein